MDEIGALFILIILLIIFLFSYIFSKKLNVKDNKRKKIIIYVILSIISALIVLFLFAIVMISLNELISYLGYPFVDNFYYKRILPIFSVSLLLIIFNLFLLNFQLKKINKIKESNQLDKIGENE